MNQNINKRYENALSGINVDVTEVTMICGKLLTTYQSKNILGIAYS